MDLKPSELKVNQKVTITDGGSTSHSMMVYAICEGKVEFRYRHRGPLGGKATPFGLHIRGGSFFDGTGKQIYIRRFDRSRDRG